MPEHTNKGSVGRLCEFVYVSGLRLFMASLCESAFTAQRFAWEAQGLDYAAMRMKSDDAESGYIVFGVVPFEGKAPRSWQREPGFPRGRARPLEPDQAAGALLCVAHVANVAQLVMSQRFEDIASGKLAVL